MTIFSFILLGMVICNHLKTKDIREIFISDFALYCAVYALYAIGHFIKIGGFRFDNEEFLCLFVFIESILILINDNILEASRYSVALFLSIILGMIFLELFPYKEYVYTAGANEYLYMKNGSSMVLPSINAQSIRFTVRIIMHIVICKAFCYISDKNTNDVIEDIITRAACINLLYLIFEVLCKGVFGSTLYQTIQLFIFNQTSFIGGEVNRIGILTLTGFWTEPTQLSAGLFATSLALVFFEKRNAIRIIVLIGNICFLMISGSFRGFMSILALVSIWMIASSIPNNRNTMVVVGLLFLAVIAVLIVIPVLDLSYYTGRLESSLNFFRGVDAVEDVSGSEYVRFRTIMEGLRIFGERPLFGLGIATNWCYATIPALLSNLGLIGTVSYFGYIMETVSMVFDKKKILIMSILIVVYFFSDTFSAVYNPMLFLSIYLLSGKEYNTVLYNNSLCKYIK